MLLFNEVLDITHDILLVVQLVVQLVVYHQC